MGSQLATSQSDTQFYSRSYIISYISAML